MTCARSGPHEVALGFDFMAEYNGTSTEVFSIDSTIDNTSDGFEIYFLSSGFTMNPPIPAPEPGTLSPLAVGAIALAASRRRSPR